MYVCMYVCIYVSMYVCMYVRMYACMCVYVYVLLTCVCSHVDRQAVVCAPLAPIQTSVQ